MLRILRKRYPLTEVVLLAVRVQGAEAPAEIAAALRYANRFRVADLIITGRGGGSIEDLWAFNDERVARAIAASEIPVISAVGHEPDVTISDYVADLRAATPSNAAELAVPDQAELRQSLAARQSMLLTLMTRRLKAERQERAEARAERKLRREERYAQAVRTLSEAKLSALENVAAALESCRDKLADGTQAAAQKREELDAAVRRLRERQAAVRARTAGSYRPALRILRGNPSAAANHQYGDAMESLRRIAEARRDD